MMPCFDKLFTATLKISTGAALAVGGTLAEETEYQRSGTSHHEEITQECDSAYYSRTASPTLSAVVAEEHTLCPCYYRTDLRTLVRSF
jgi:hypothetical protein